MPVPALLLFTVFAALGFGWRSWQQHRRTGSTGFRGISGNPGSPEWLAGVGFIVAMGVAVTAPLLQLVGVVGAPDAPWLHLTGVAIAALGIAVTVYAQVDMGDSWRIGVDADDTTTLVRSGLFGVVRNPIFTAMLVFAAGMVLVTPNIVAVIGFALLVASIEVQVRVVEEPYLSTLHGESYREYAASVGRFVPGVGRLP